MSATTTAPGREEPTRLGNPVYEPAFVRVAPGRQERLTNPASSGTARSDGHHEEEED